MYIHERRFAELCSALLKALLISIIVMIVIVGLFAGIIYFALRSGAMLQSDFDILKENAGIVKKVGIQLLIAIWGLFYYYAGAIKVGETSAAPAFVRYWAQRSGKVTDTGYLADKYSGKVHMANDAVGAYNIVVTAFKLIPFSIWLVSAFFLFPYAVVNVTLLRILYNIKTSQEKNLADNKLIQFLAFVVSHIMAIAMFVGVIYFFNSQQMPL